ncbi:MAG: phosphoribosylaminoimidazolesuccinocarboxamide synthase [Pyrinomonadaceae bacterium MAG19_C2-C3]|nr:phosphoribosylaminoimidazolesuccinocarboxamide synthase [Pyrinomonadaceae bacterium MAG19_C2-C3]
MTTTTMHESDTPLDGLTLRAQGKVRDVYTVDEEYLLLVASDRISAFDCVLPTRITGKGAILTELSKFWFDRLKDLTPHHLVTTDVDEMPDIVRRHAARLRHRSMLVRRTKVFPIECVVRGYLAGSGWKDYQSTGAVCGHTLPAGLREADQLPEAIFTPATKAAKGHDENISERKMENIIGSEATKHLRETSLDLYARACEHAAACGIIIADTKFEFGTDTDGRTLLIDEVLTPDSSRFWDTTTYQAGTSPPSYDKQFVRDYLETLSWDKRPPAPELPPEIVQATVARYKQAYQLLTGNAAAL